MRSVQITAPGEVVIVDAEPTAPGTGEVQIRVELFGVCATDAHILHGSFPTAKYPVRPGHEATGTVAQVGEGVSHVQVGDRVVIDPGSPCGTCYSCRDGRFNLCEDRHAFGIDLLGAGAEFITLPAKNVLPIGDVPFHSAVLAEPLACVVHGMDMVPDVMGRRVLVVGAGTIGLLALIVARSQGARTIAVVDTNEARLATAAATGADVTSSNLAEQIAGRDWDLTIDATGVPAVIGTLLEGLRRGGTHLQLGVADPDKTLPLSPYLVFARELHIQGSMTTRHSFPRAIEILQAGLVDGTVFTSEPFALEDYPAAIAQAGSGVTPKIVVTPRRAESTE